MRNKSKVFNILFLGGAKRISIAKQFVKSGKKVNLNVKLFSYELEKIVPFSLVGKVIIGKKWNDKNLIKDLIKLIKKEKISLVLASVDQATLILPKLNYMLSRNIAVTCDLKVLNMILDKRKMNTFCSQNNIKYIEENRSSFPFLIKPRKGAASKNVIIVENYDHFKFIKNKFNLENFIFQKYIKGIEYSVDAYVNKNGEIIGCIPRERNKVFQGEVILSKVVHNSQLISITKEIIKKMNIYGPVNLQFIKHKNSYLLLEINPRLGGGVLAVIESGFDITKIMLQDFLDIKINKNIQYKNLIMMRYMIEGYYEINN